MGKRGPPRTPTHLRLLRGNPGHQKINRIENEPQPVIDPAVPPAPTFLVGYALEEWERMAAELHRLKLLSVIDIHPLAAYCQAFGIWRSAVEAFTEIAKRDPVMHGLMIKAASGTALQNPVLLTMRQAANDMVRYAAEFGLTPAARSRISSLDVDDPQSKFGRLLAS